MENFIYSIGLGLGDPELVTVKAVKNIRVFRFDHCTTIQ